MDFLNLEAFCNKIVNPNPIINYLIGDEIRILKKNVDDIKEEVLVDLNKHPESRELLLKDIRKYILNSKFIEVENNKNLKNWFKENNINIKYVIKNNLYDSVLTNYKLATYKKFQSIISNDKTTQQILNYEVYGYFCKHFRNDLLDFLDEQSPINKIMEDVLRSYKNIDFHNLYQSIDYEDEQYILAKYIFKSDSLKIFNSLLEKFGINKETSKKRGVQAKLKAIWSCPASKKRIFKEHSELKDYIKYLNYIFELKYNSRTMSDGYNYHISIQNWLKEI